MIVTRILTSFLGLASLTILCLWYHSTDGLDSLLLKKNTAKWTPFGWNDSSTPHESNSIHHMERGGKRFRVSGLRYQNFRIGNPAEESPTGKIQTTRSTKRDASNNEFGMLDEEVDFWRRALQEGSLSSASMSFSFSMSQGPPKEYVNRFENNGEHGYVREKVFGEQTYTCACNSRYGNWMEYRKREYQSVAHNRERERDLAGTVRDFDGRDEQREEGITKVEGGIDFFIAGFPKCGTTTLLHAFNKHKETSIHEKEVCDFVSKRRTDDEAMSKLNQALVQLDTSSIQQKRGIKCPTGLRDFQSLNRLQRHSPNTRIVVGVRHPVRFFESFYNYRVTETYNNNSTAKIPPVESTIGSKEWQGVSTDNAQFEAFLMQLGKTPMTLSDMELISHRPELAVKPFPFKVLLYSLEQLEDTDVSRSATLRKDIQEFLQLEDPVEPFSQENRNHFVGDNAHPETIDICDNTHSGLRALLLSQAKKSQNWIRNSFLKSSDVSAAGEEHFLQMLDTWSVDPCAQTEEMY